jgi:CPA2 family monovalent cation:H+ antiporter-2
LGWIAAWVGYSLALGAFVLGAVVSGTRFRIEIERRFDPLKHTFGAIFFVAIGMLFDLRLLVEAWPMILGITLLVLIFRPLACALGLLSVGNSSRDALRAGLSLTPIGEFSLVMAQVGTASAVVPEKFYALAVGLCLTTSLTAPWITRNRDVVADVIIRLQPGFLAQWLLFYQEQLAHLYSLRGSSSLWRLTRGRLIQIAMHFLFISALLLASGPINRWLLHRFGEDWLVPHGISIGFWLVFGLGLLAPLISLWRNLEAVCMLLADGSTAGYPRRSVVRPLFESALKVVSALVLAIWFVSLLPVATASVWSLVIAALLLVLPGIYFHRRLLRWHSRVDFELKEEFASASNAGASAGLQLAFLKRPEEWNMEIHEVTLPAETAHAGKSIGDLALRTRAGCSIVGMDRQGFIFNNPRAADCVYPGDRLLLLGSPQQLAEADRFLIGPAKATVPAESFGELTTETLEIPASWPTSGRTLRQLNLMQRFRVQVGGISRKQKRIVVPTGTDRVLPGDRLLVLGTYGRIQECRQWLSQAVREDIDEEGLADEPEN